jgi:hypothetical protein
MAWVSHTLAFAILPDQADVGADLRTLLDGPKRAMDQFVYAPSRNGCVLWRLGRICEQARHGKNLYLLEDACLLQHAAVQQSASQIEPLPAEMVYPGDAIIKDGWVYNHTEEQVLRLLDQSCASQTPCPDGDDDGESLAFVFNFLKSHLALLHLAAGSGRFVVYGEMNQ